MAEILLTEQAPPAAPAAGDLFLFPHAQADMWASRESTGKIILLPGLRNCNIADEVANAADTYLQGSKLIVPSHLLQARARYRWRLAMTKSGAGVVAPFWNVRVGTLGTVADASRLLFTSAFAQTAVVDAGVVDIDVILRNIGAAGVMAGVLQMRHNLQITGLAVVPSPSIVVTSAAFDTTVANLIVGISVHPGAAGVWTHQLISAEMLDF